MPELALAIDVLELTKRYGPPDSGLLAVIRLLAGLSQPTAGQARILGLDRSQHLPQIKKRIGVVPEASNLYDELTAFANLIFSMQLYGVPRAERAPRAEELLARFRLADKRDTPFARLSRGMKRALTIATALAHRPALLFLDEPTTGLDVLSARNLRKMIAGLRQEGVTVFLTTHYLEEAERLCDRIALLVRGRIVALDTVAGLKAQVQGATAVEVTLQKGNAPPETRRLVGEEPAALVREAISLTEVDGQRLLAIHTVQPTLEDVFVQLTGLSAEVMQAEKGVKGK